MIFCRLELESKYILAKRSCYDYCVNNSHSYLLVYAFTEKMLLLNTAINSFFGDMSIIMEQNNKNQQTRNKERNKVGFTCIYIYFSLFLLISLF